MGDNIEWSLHQCNNERKKNTEREEDSIIGKSMNSKRGCLRGGGGKWVDTLPLFRSPPPYLRFFTLAKEFLC